MTEIDFLIEERVFAEDLTFDPSSADPAALEETYFIMPTRVRVGEVDLFTSNANASPWHPLPVLGFATHLLEALRKCPPDTAGAIFLAGGGEFRFELEGKDLTVICTLTKRSASDSRDNVYDAAERFSKKVQLFLMTRVIIGDRPPTVCYREDRERFQMLNQCNFCGLVARHDASRSKLRD
jgi:hypothetical protein